MTDARTGSINLIANARGDKTAALVQSMYAVVDFLPDRRHMVAAGALVAVADFAQNVTIETGSLYALADTTIPTTVQADNIYLIADFNPAVASIASIASIYAICDAVRPKFAQANGITAVVNARNQSPRALAATIVAVVNARSIKPHAIADGIAAVASMKPATQVQASDIQAVAVVMVPTQMQAGGIHLLADGSAKQQPQQTHIGALYAIVNGVLAGQPHEYLPNRMRHGKRSKLGAISPYGAT